MAEVVRSVYQIDPDATVSMQHQRPGSNDRHCFVFPGATTSSGLAQQIIDKFGGISEDAQDDKGVASGGDNPPWKLA